MIIVSASQFYVYLPCLGACLAQFLNSVLNLKAVVGIFNQEKALIGALSKIMNLRFKLYTTTTIRHQASGKLMLKLQSQTTAKTDTDSDSNAWRGWLLPPVMETV